MDFSSFRTFPIATPPDTLKPTANKTRIYPRIAWNLFRLTWVSCFILLLLWLRQTTETIQNPAPKTTPLPFNEIESRFALIRFYMRSEELYSLLGPENYVKYREPEFARYEQLVEAHPDRYPEGRHWAKWADPTNQDKWVAVFIAGDRVFQILKKGF